jgi:AcrR family transcriptional regulator
VAYADPVPFTPRSEGTRRAILTATRELLASRGYEGTTIRAVAAAAGVDPSMVMRYYGSKRGLFAAAVDLDLRLPDLTAYPRDRLGERLARHFVSRWEGALADEAITLLLRSAITNPLAAEHMRAIFATQVLGMVRDVVGDTADAPRRAAMVTTQVLGAALCRYVLRLPPVAAVDGDTLAATMAPVLQHYLTGPLDTPCAI